MYQSGRKTEQYVNDIDLALNFADSKLVLKHYSLTYAKQKLFSTKPSVILLKDDIVSIESLWFNDQLQLGGDYDIKAKKGTIDAVAKKLLISHEIFDLDSIVDIKTVVDGNKTSVSGNVILLGGNMNYDLVKKLMLQTVILLLFKI